MKWYNFFIYIATWMHILGCFYPIYIWYRVYEQYYIVLKRHNAMRAIALPCWPFYLTIICYILFDKILIKFITFLCLFKFFTSDGFWVDACQWRIGKNGKICSKGKHGIGNIWIVVHASFIFLTILHYISFLFFTTFSLVITTTICRQTPCSNTRIVLDFNFKFQQYFM